MVPSTRLLAFPILAVILSTPQLSHRTGASTFSQEDRGLTVFADGYIASQGANDAYVPVAVAVALMRTGPSIAFTTRSFTLVDAEGHAVAAEDFDEVKNHYPKLSYDRKLLRARPITLGLLVENHPRIASSFYPPTNAGTRIPRVELGPFSWFTDVIYFPRPKNGLGGVMTLSVAVPDAPPIEVGFLMSRAKLEE
jgi:hypothetical protein